MFVIESCQKIEYNALFMMIFIPVSNFGDQPLRNIWMFPKVAKITILQVTTIYFKLISITFNTKKNKK